MKKNAKRILALLLCAVMCISVASPALAVYYPHGTVIDEDSGQIANGGHAVVVVRKIYMRNDDGSIRFRGVVVAEGNYGGNYNWGRLIPEEDVKNGTVTIFSCYRIYY